MNSNEVIKKLQIKNGKLQVQIERLKLDKEEYYLDYLNLQSRLDKAIEYIKSYHNTGLWECDKENLLNILRGEDNE